jgi:hypothetical protein
LLIRFVAFCALGMVGLSFGGVFVFGFVALPVYAASRLASHHDPDRYLVHDGPKVIRVIHWFAALCAWASLVADELPENKPSEVLELSIEEDAASEPSAASAIWRVIAGLPSAVVFLVLCFIGVFVLFWATLTVLFQERVGPRAFRYLVGLQRWGVRLLAYQASLVDQYPPFSFSDEPSSLPRASAAA